MSDEQTFEDMKKDTIIKLMSIQKEFGRLIDDMEETKTPADINELVAKFGIDVALKIGKSMLKF